MYFACLFSDPLHPCEKESGSDCHNKLLENGTVTSNHIYEFPVYVVVCRRRHRKPLSSDTRI